MTTLQQYLDQKYPTKEDKEGVKEINTIRGVGCRLIEGDLNLSKYINVERVIIRGGILINSLWNVNVVDCTKLIYLDIMDCKIEKIDLTNNKELKCLWLNNNRLSNIVLKTNTLTNLNLKNNCLTSVDFLNQLPNPEKLEWLEIWNNNIEPTDISIFSKFVNLRNLKIGTTKLAWEAWKHNKFYGSLKSYQNLIKLESICIETTDVDSGLEYLPFSLEKGYSNIECSPHNTSAKCKAIQDALRPYDYDLEAWQLAHPHRMFEARPELFSLEDSKEKWTNALKNKLEQTNIKLLDYKQNQSDKVKKIKRIESKVRELKRIEQLLEERTIFEDSLSAGVRWYDKFKEDKSTQTDLTSKQLEETDRIVEQIRQIQLPNPKK